MSRIHALNYRYAASASLVRYGVEIFSVGDPLGARLNAATRQLMIASRDDGPGLWDDLVGAVKSLRWRLATQPQPITLNLALKHGAEQVILQVRRLRGAVANDALLDELTAAADQIGESDPALGPVLLRSIEEVGPSDCVVVAANATASVAIGEWLRELGVKVLTVGELQQLPPGIEQSYVVGPPRFFRSSLVTAPVTSAVSFVMPAWFRDRQIPRSAIAQYADGAIRIAARVFDEGDLTEPTSQVAEDPMPEDEYLPQPFWNNDQAPDGEPSNDEVVAHKLLLGGNLAIWLDDGERIRTLDAQQPLGERVTYTDVAAVRPGTYLLLRQGETERRALYEAALSRLGERGAAIDESQRAWKQHLQTRLIQLGYRGTVRELRMRGVKTADRARAWVEPNLIRPHRDQDFEQLLQWLGDPIQPSFGNATLLRRAIYQASAEVREQLERAVASADLSALKRDGHLRIDTNIAGFRGIVATRVLAISPYARIVSRYDARVPYEDWSGRWLE